ncbi:MULTISPECIES: hypothetical protein [unclassified Variovorax]|uniref:hypothetical protein n=1 Tax=unclassified Variovorax TaxID=663243 RepID=UPI001316DDD6|nr:MULTISPECIES: hypothetical protein [unclassified Variovorax]VTU43259.1 hypothetical protein SRS16P1_00479 [Variovorax sp. SRS16]VTU43282.1 hypothetical protein E5P1_00476 [Variovorax sp. PBL-E5]VTU43340.1 hypothetical protein H6P1_00427 [Variovorax sp. PBL-H6]
MAANITVTFPPEARIDAIGAAFAISAGSPFHLSEAAGARYPRVPSLRVSVRPDCVGMAHVELRTGTGDILAASYHFEFGKKGERGMLLPFDARWLALALAVVAQLGGSVAVDTAAGVSKEVLSVPTRWPEDPEDEGFAQLQELVLAIPHISADDIDRAEPLLRQ